jgi:lysine biosynthesis protein LysW
MPLATCVECDEAIEINGRPKLGMRLLCAYCGAKLEVVNLAPVEVDWAYEDDEDDDWDDEEGFDGESDDEFADDLDDDDLADDELDDDFEDDDDETWR